MKYTLKYCLATAIFLFLSVINFSCDKQDWDLFSTPAYIYPVVKTVSVMAIGGGVVQVTGQIISQGSSAVQFGGVCFGRDANPSLLENQTLLNVVNGQFVLDIDTLSSSATYYFKTFAANSEGYGVSNVFQFGLGPAPPPTVPCSLVSNVVYVSGQAYIIDQVNSGSAYASYGNWAVVGTNSATNETFDIEFVNQPGNGVYTTSTSSDILNNSNNTFVSWMDGFGDIYYINPGSQVYVTVESNGAISISFCNLSCGVATLKGNIVN